MSWLMLVTDVPSKPDYLRVKLRRRVQRLGAIGLKGAVYLLPEGADAMESFQWLRREIVGEGGNATICSATLIDGLTDGDVTDLFNRDRNAEFAEFVAACQALAGRWNGAAEGERGALVAERGRLFGKMEEILGRDFFAASGREEAMQAMEGLAVLDILGDLPASGGDTERFTNRTWATRPGVKVDRIASAWLIRRLVDPGAAFVFVADAAAAPPGSVRIDMFGGEFTHDGNRCTYEVLLDHFGITDAALRIIGQMVHDIDLHDDAFARPETAGFAAMIDGILSTVAADEDRLREGAVLLDRFAAGLRRE